MSSNIDLTGEWRLRVESEKATAESDIVPIDQDIPCSIPGDGHSALLSAGLIPDPFYGQNELALRALDRADFIFERTIYVSAERLASGKPFIHFDSIDTVATVHVNDVEVAKSANMFRRLRADVSTALKAGENTIRVVCASAEKEALRRAADLPYSVPCSPAPVYSPNRNLLRKTQCHSGWDWGPCFMVAGIYGACYIGFSDPGRIEQLSARTLKTGIEWRVPVRIDYFVPESRIDASATVDVELRDSRGTVVANGRRDYAQVRPGTNKFEVELSVSNPELWWPAGYGEQPLYRLIAKVQSRTDFVPQTWEKRLGFRELRVIAEEDSIGRSLTFHVNGRDVWAKGANWIPTDSLPGRQSAEGKRELLESMVNANMNMVRVWGGGQYESDSFYDACDELGILVWQDMMFACALYPANKEFLVDVREEIVDQVNRLKEHPSIALWCGNNENLGALNWYPESRKFRDRYLIDYDHLNEGVVGSTIRELDPDRTWWPSSPSAGPADFTDCWHADGRGDMHYWSVWHESKPFEAYYAITPRFCSEFGYQSFPSEEGVASYCPEEDRNLTSPTMEHHQKNARGNSIIIENFSRYFRFPEGFANMLYLSQVQQALAMKMAVEYWRSLRPVCMGALYWQLNDCWPVASWSSIEYSGKWKLLHYAAARFFAPLGIVAYKKEGRVSVFLLNDTETPARGTVSIRLLHFDGSEAWRTEKTVDAVPEAAMEVFGANMDTLTAHSQDVFLVAEFTPASANPADIGTGHALRNDLFLTAPKKCPLVEPKLRTEVIEAEGDLTVKLSSEAPAFFVALDAPGIPGRWEDNLFTLLAGEVRAVRFIPKRGTNPSASALRAALTTRHLRGTYR